MRPPQRSHGKTSKAKTRLYVHLLNWPMGQLALEGYADRVQYARLLHDPSEVKMSTRKDTAWISEETKSGDLILRFPVVKPSVEIPVIELFLK